MFSTVQRSGDQARARVADAAGKASQLSENARDVIVTGRNTSMERTEEVARQQGDATTARSVHETRTKVGALHESELPIQGYDKLVTFDAAAAVTKLDRVDDLNKVIH